MQPKIVNWAKFEGKLFSDAKYLGPLLQRSPLNRWLFLETRAWAACGLIYFMQAFETLKIDYLLSLIHYVIVLKYNLLSLLLLFIIIIIIVIIIIIILLRCMV